MGSAACAAGAEVAVGCVAGATGVAVELSPPMQAVNKGTVTTTRETALESREDIFNAPSLLVGPEMSANRRPSLMVAFIYPLSVPGSQIFRSLGNRIIE